MRVTTRTAALAALALTIGTASCSSGGSGKASPGAAGTGAAATAPTASAKSAAASASPRGASGSSAAKASRGSKADGPAAPAGAQYTVFCLSVPGEGHVMQATRLRDQLVRSTGMRDWYVVHGAEESTLYYGYYRSIDRSEDPKETARARADREKIGAMVDASGVRPFRNALLVELAAPDPEAPPQWDLRNTPPGSVWSLQVAAYEGHPDRKKYAVDAVKAFRDNGVPAFFYHGDTVSSVCIGAWPAKAVRGDLEPAYNDPNTRRSMDQIMNPSSGADLLVVAPGLPPINKDVTTKNGKPLRAVSPHLEAVDPTLLATMKNYPHHYRNGVVEAMNTAQGVTGKPSLLVQIPRRDTMLGGGYEGSAVAGGTVPGLPSDTHAPVDARTPSGLPPGVGAAAVTPPPPAAASRPPAPQQPAPPPAPGYGRLRSLEDR